MRVRPVDPRLSVHLATSSWLWSGDWPWRLGEILGAVCPGLAPRGVHLDSRLRPWQPRHVAAAYADMLAVVDLGVPGASLTVWGRTDPGQSHGLVTITGPARAAEQPGLLTAVRALALATCADYGHVHVLTAADLAATPPGTITQIDGLAVTGGDDLGETGLPYLWWGTLLGAAWTGILDQEQLAGSPAAAVERVAPDLWWMRLTGDVLDPVHRPAAVEAARQRVLGHLPRDIFGTRQAPAARIPVLPPPPGESESADAAHWDDAYVVRRAADAGWVDMREQALRRLLTGAHSPPRTSLTLGRPRRPLLGLASLVAPAAGAAVVEVRLATAAALAPDLVDLLLADLADAAPKLAGQLVEGGGPPATPEAGSLARALARGGARIDCGAAEVTVDLPDPELALPHAVVGLRAGLGAEESFPALPAVVRRWAARLRPFYGQCAVDPPVHPDGDEEDEDGTVTVEDLAGGLPDPAWATVLGPAYADLIGAERLLSAPIAVAEQIAPGVFWLQLTAGIQDPADRPEAVAEARRALRRHLGEHFFRGARRPRVPSRSALLRLPG